MIRNQEIYKKIKLTLDILFSLLGFLAISLLITFAGFHLSSKTLELLWYLVDALVVTFIIEELIRWIINFGKKQYFLERWFEILLTCLLFFNLILPDPLYYFFNYIFPEFTKHQLILVYLAFISIPIIVIVFVKALRYNHLFSKLQLHPGSIFALSFAFIIIVGSLLLMLPKATPAEKSISYIDSLFTSTSAVCVTGLVVVDTAKDFAVFGKIVIILLIQIGGLGVMTLTTFFAAFLAGGMSYKMRIMMKELLSNESIGEVSSLLLKITLVTISIEGIGAIILYFSMGGTLSHINHNYIYVSIFHSVSAFCNAGFSLYTDNLMDKTLFSNYLFNTTIMFLIILGGIGFTVITNILSLKPPKRKSKRIKYQLAVSTKLVLITTSILIFGGGLLIYLTNPFPYNTNLTWIEKLFHSIFLSVSSRTAGFNTIPIDKISFASAMIVIVLMWIGASPGSTGGGVKTTTFSIALLSLINIIKGKDRLEIFYREIPQENIKKSFLVIFSSLLMLAICSTILMYIEPDKQPLDLVFEAVSAIGTVGLSRNLSQFLGDGGKTIDIILMYVGRIGVLTFFLSFFRPPAEPRYKLPSENIMIG